MPSIITFNNNHIIVRADSSIKTIDINGLKPSGDGIENYSAPLSWFSGDCKKITAYYTSGSSAQEITWVYSGHKMTLPHNANVFVSDGGLNSSTLHLIDCKNNVLAELTPASG